MKSLRIKHKWAWHPLPQQLLLRFLQIGFMGMAQHINASLL